MNELVQKAGGKHSTSCFKFKTEEFCADFELQVSILECLFRLTAVTERVNLADHWFSHLQSLSEAFNSIREAFFEVVCHPLRSIAWCHSSGSRLSQDCRRFLNLLNESCADDRTVFSLPCKRAFLGSFEVWQYITCGCVLMGVVTILPRAKTDWLLAKSICMNVGPG
jgi:hypothetical protein